MATKVGRTILYNTFHFDLIFVKTNKVSVFKKKKNANIHKMPKIWQAMLMNNHP